MAQSILDVFPDAISDFGLLGCLALILYLALMAWLAFGIASRAIAARKRRRSCQWRMAWHVRTFRQACRR